MPQVAPTQLNPAERAQRFAQMTRQNKKGLPKQTSTENNTLQFQLPKVRLLSRIRLLVEASVKVTHATATAYTPSQFAPFNLLRRVSVDINNGFSPFTVGGREAYMYNLARHELQALSVQNTATVNRAPVTMGLVASAAGTNNNVKFVVDLPITLNQRDPIGLILLQNEETVVTVTVDTATVAGLISAAGYTVALNGNISITPMVETFSIPPAKEAFPDLSVLKLVQSKSESVAGAGQFTLKLPVGTTYRKLILYFEDANGNPMKDTDFQGDIELVFNQSDVPYSLSPSFLSAENHEQFGSALPDGMYVFDFTYQGLANYGGARDYVDTEKLTEFWVRFNAPFAGKVTAVYETITRLRTN